MIIRAGMRNRKTRYTGLSIRRRSCIECIRSSPFIRLLVWLKSEELSGVSQREPVSHNEFSGKMIQLFGDVRVFYNENNTIFLVK